MNILFFSLYSINDSNSGYIYADLIKEFAKAGHNVYAITTTNYKTESFIDDNNVTIIKIKNGTIEKRKNKIKKVINLLGLDSKVIIAVKRYAKGIHFDCVINMCSNLAFYKATKYFKNKHHSYTYLLLKDIFPHNAVDMEMIKTKGLLKIIYQYFRRKEKKFYSFVDKIGCISQKNEELIINNNPTLNKDKVEVCPNSVIPNILDLNDIEKKELRNKYHIPLDKKVFVYGGNFGKPQGIPFIIDCLRELRNSNNAFFFLVGDGTEYKVLEKFMNEEKPSNIILYNRLPREDFDKMLYCCDVGLIFLDYKFTMPNYPSRILSYMQASLPVLAATDTATDIGSDIVNGSFGWWCPSNDVNKFCSLVNSIIDEDLTIKKQKSKEYLITNFSTKQSVEIILKGVNK